jgi:sigma-B regulation protein RsbU (phosphoserine phosphatase)
VEAAEYDLESMPGKQRALVVHEGAADREGVDGMNAETESEFDSEKPTVLYVEDNADLRNHVRGLLKQNYNVFLAVDGKDGLFKTRKFKPDLIISDQMMPRMSGRALLREIRNDPALSSTPIILLTAKAGAESRIESLDAGADDYLTKPFDEAELNIRIRNLLRARAQKRELAELNRKLEAQVAEQLAELDFAGRIQNDLLPKTAPELSGYEIAGRNIPAKQVGGDYFDFIPLDEYRVAICLGDVCGKGLPASLLMANLQATIRAQAMYCSSVSECLEKSNKLLYHRTDKKTFISLFIGILDTQKHTLCYANAGQNPPIVFTQGIKPRMLEKRGLVLGVQEDFTYEEEEVAINIGDFILIYSDGITEAMNEESEEFGEERLQDIVVIHRDRPPDQLIDRIISAVEYFIRGRAAGDDMTLIALKRE